MNSKGLKTMWIKQIRKKSLGIFFAVVIILTMTMLAWAETPNYIQYSNIASDLMTITFYTENAVTASLKYAQSPPLTSTAVDSYFGTTTPSYIHYFNLSGLVVGGTYLFDIISDGVTYNNGGTHYTFSLPSSNPPGFDPPNFILISSNVRSIGNTGPQENTLVYFRITDGTNYSVTASARTTADGNFIISAKYLKDSSDLSQFFDFQPGDTLLVSMRAGDSLGGLETTRNSPLTQSTPVGLVDVTPSFVLLAQLDFTSPNITATNPTSGQNNVPTNNNITIQITDSSGISLNSIIVTVDGQLAFTSGVQQAGFAVATSNISNGYQLVVNPDSNFTWDERVTVDVEADDLATPSENTQQYTYIFDVEPVETTPPTITPTDPTANQTNVPTDNNITIQITDASGVSLNSIMVTVDSQIAFTDGVQQTGFAVATSSIASGYQLVINPDSDFVSGSRITVDVRAIDTSPSENEATLSYGFDIVVVDITGPVIAEISPTDSATDVPTDNAVVFTITDAVSGVSLNSIRVTIAGTLAVEDGVAQAGFSIANTAIANGYRITINHTTDFDYDTVIAVSIRGLDNDDNPSILNYSFTTAVEPDDLDSLNIPRPMAVPTIFNPKAGETTDLLYTLSEDRGTYVRIYDLRGYRLFERRYSAGEMGARAGNNKVIWNGRDDNGRLQSNGIYMFFVVTDKGKVLAKGKMVISNQ